jgi:ssDNA-binding Zn-finger/Zn-ribbon topoisomerase 1
MTELKCPFCGQELEKYYWHDLEYYACSNLTCDGYYMTATQDMWQAPIDTKKKLDDLSDKNGKLKSKLDIAVGAIKKADHHIRICHYVQARTDLRQALEQITELEQKDVK